jgi:hypothetical protein
MSRNGTLTFPDGRKTVYTTKWNNDPKKCYYKLAKPAGAPWEKTWYDQVGRVVETETVGVKGTPIKSTTYDEAGNQKTLTDPNAGTFLPTSMTHWGVC